MSLLTEVMQRPLDPGYAAAAERRRAAGDTRPGRPRALTALAALAVGVLLAVAGVRAATGAPEADRGRAGLLERVRAATERADDLAARAARLRAANAELATRLGGAPAAVAGARADALAVAAGAVPVTGPGVEVVLRDAAPDPTAASASSGRVVDRDLQLLVNGLWQAGAEAVAVNGLRLSSLSSIRAAGEAVLVDYRPLTPPYRVTAIGDPVGLQTRLASSVAGRYLQVLEDNYGIGVEVRARSGEDASTLPAAARLQLRAAAPPDGAGGTGAAGTVPGTGATAGADAGGGPP
ncbi:DUF881 domain-containing protein [Kineococcus sp. TRM81007]|uniref:DUF881 domain-containing protein n=1 Tax=Kineococcus sp. TRM81007 TaxID=2925831 RepID=UPI001F59125A|nr:DUF881 domain-containing protein [Kineococcus sp. TRM81007]MCI2240670.1 DUF881 domain-containing protein [Kineococcus sp. TRM81007]